MSVDERPWRKVEVYRDTAGSWRWRRIAENGEPVAYSGEPFADKGSAETSARREFPEDELVVVD